MVRADAVSASGRAAGGRAPAPEARRRSRRFGPAATIAAASSRALRCRCADCRAGATGQGPGPLRRTPGGVAVSARGAVHVRRQSRLWPHAPSCARWGCRRELPAGIPVSCRRLRRDPVRRARRVPGALPLARNSHGAETRPSGRQRCVLAHDRAEREEVWSGSHLLPKPRCVFARVPAGEFCTIWLSWLSSRDAPGEPLAATWTRNTEDAQHRSSGDR
jgi:hypothetical protein